jgi:hypothetical protein
LRSLRVIDNREICDAEWRGRRITMKTVRTYSSVLIKKWFTLKIGIAYIMTRFKLKSNHNALLGENIVKCIGTKF